MNRTESPVNPHNYGQLIFKRMPRQFSGERVEFSVNSAGYPDAQNMKLDSCTSHYKQEVTQNRS